MTLGARTSWRDVDIYESGHWLMAAGTDPRRCAGSKVLYWRYRVVGPRLRPGCLARKKRPERAECGDRRTTFHCLR